MQIDLIKLAPGIQALAQNVDNNNEILKSAIYELEERLNGLNPGTEEEKIVPAKAAFEIFYYYSNVAPTGAYPLWTGQWINRCQSLYPDFWDTLVKRKEAGQVRAIDNETYENEVEQTGQCGAFVVDEENGHVRLPKITRFISSLENETDIGTTQDAVLQKHNHNFIASTNGGAHGATSDSYVASNTYAASSERSLWTTPGNVINKAVISESDGDSKGHPQNVRLGLYIQVANNAAEISRLDIEVIEKELIDAVDEISTLKSGALGEIGTLKSDAVDQIRTLKSDAINQIGALKSDAVDEIGALKSGAIDEISALKSSALDEITTNKDNALGEMDTALQEALEQLNASDVLSGIETALNQINGGY